jgi:hypothetical protein
VKIPIAIAAAASALPAAIGLSALSAPADKVRIGYRVPLKDIERRPGEEPDLDSDLPARWQR